MDLAVRVEVHDHWTVARVHGDLDLTTAPRLREQLVATLTSTATRLVLDLQDVAFIDSTGLGVLVGILKRTRTLGGDLRLVSTRPALRDLLRLTDLDQALRCFDDVASATVDGPAGS
jgi:anti-sigma B factor antagonist